MCGEEISACGKRAACILLYVWKLIMRWLAMTAISTQLATGTDNDQIWYTI